MMDWTDRHCRYLHRLITKNTLLYTEMVTTGALLRGDVERHLRFDASEHRVALQLGGSEPADLAACAKLGQDWGYDEINLNCGCPSPRVQRGSFGACLMSEADLVADCVKAMRDASQLPITVKNRIGVDKTQSYEFVRDFIGTVAQAGCEVFIVHARSAWLDGLSPKENREIPPLRYDIVHRLKRDFPQLTIAINGGITQYEEIAVQLQAVDGVMLGRKAYHEPYFMHEFDARFWPEKSTVPSLEREAVEAEMVRHMEREAASNGLNWHSIARHMLGLYHGQPGARLWRQVWSDHRLRQEKPLVVMQKAQAQLAAFKYLAD